MSFFHYWGSVLRRALRPSFDLAQGVLFAAFLAAGLFSYFVPQLHVLVGAISGWGISLGVLGAILIVRILLAPMQWHRELETELHWYEGVLEELQQSPMAIARREQAVENARLHLKLERAEKRDEFYRRQNEVGGG